MRKKIMLVVLILTTMLLTACETIITSEEVKTFENIAYEIKNSEGYKLPDGYSISYPDSTTTSKICISVETTNKLSDEISAIFDITKDEPELIKYETKIRTIIIVSIIVGVIIGFVIGFLKYI